MFIDSDVLVHGSAGTRIRQASRRTPPDRGSRRVRRLADRAGNGLGVPQSPAPLGRPVGTGAGGTFWTGLGAVRERPVSKRPEGSTTALGARRQRERRVSSPRLARPQLLAEAGHRITTPDPGHPPQAMDARADDLHRFPPRGVPWVHLLPCSAASAPVHLNLGWRHPVHCVSLLAAVSSCTSNPAVRTMAAMLVLINRRFPTR